MKKSTMKQGENEVKQPHISEGMNINSDECEIEGGKPGEFTAFDMLDWLIDPLVRVGASYNTRITIDLERDTYERVSKDLRKTVSSIDLNGFIYCNYRFSIRVIDPHR